MKKESWTERFARSVTNWAGSTSASVLALGTVIVWAITGPFFDFNETWQLVINTGTTIVTFLMVFLIQRTQNKDSQAIHLKLNELVAAMQGASNRLLNIEDISEQELKTLHVHYDHLAKLAAAERNLGESHSIEEAEGRHKAKHADASTGKPRRPAMEQ